METQQLNGRGQGIGEPEAGPLSIFSLEGRKALVTGASRGIGAAIAGVFAGAGADVALLARSTEALEEVARPLRTSGRTALAIPCDVTVPEQVDEALARSPATLVHSDWKAGNLGSLPDSRTILLDWAFPGRAPPCVDLAWYLAVNCERLPHSKEEAIDHYRRCLEGQGIDTSEWWEEQLELSLLGALVLLGWSKTGAELAWWEERTGRALPYLR